ncbi:GroES-like protein [Peniophora sp. CONT]|nr:GroES-like protein [Peniophora sp. CONT]
MSNQQHIALILSAPGVFEIGKRPTPTPGPEQVLIRNRAVAVNPVDSVIHKTGYILGPHGWPVVMGNDGAGGIVALGEGVTGWRVGDKVFYQSGFEPNRGTYQELTIADAARIARISEKLSYEEVVTLPLALATAAIGAYRPRSERLLENKHDAGGAGLTPPWESSGRGKYAGQPALIMSGSSSVGQFAIQLAKLSGFDPIITTASKRNEAYCKSAGATHVLDYHDVPYAELRSAVANIIGDASLDYIYDAVSNSDSQKTGWDMLAPSGAMVIVAPPSEAIGKPGKDDAMGRRVVWVFGNVNDPVHHEFGTGMYAVLTEMLEKGELKPNQVESLGHGLEVVPGGIEKLQKGVSGVKLVATL